MTIIAFRQLVLLTSLFIASISAYYSIVGISTLFSGSKISAIIMATSLEIGKLVATSFLFKYWSVTRNFLKTYLTLSVIVLMVITSLGTFGYLTSSYQKSSLDDKFLEHRIGLYTTNINNIQLDITFTKNRISNIMEIRKSQEERLSSMSTNNLLTRNPIQFQELQSQTVDLISNNDKKLADENAKISEDYKKIEKIQSDITDLKLKSMEKNDIVAFKFVADELGVRMDSMVKWFIIIIISVFDPLAICLLLAYNTSVYNPISVSSQVSPETRSSNKSPGFYGRFFSNKK